MVVQQRCDNGTAERVLCSLGQDAGTDHSEIRKVALNVLVVDDSGVARAMIRKTLVMAGLLYRVVGGRGA